MLLLWLMHPTMTRIPPKNLLLFLLYFCIDLVVSLERHHCACCSVFSLNEKFFVTDTNRLQKMIDRLVLVVAGGLFPSLGRFSKL